MSLIKGIIEEELSRLEELSAFYKNKIAEAPRGSISVKERSGKKYLYLAHREKEKIIFAYIGKDIPDVRNNLEKSIAQRKEYQEKLRQVRENLKEVRRSLRGKKA